MLIIAVVGEVGSGKTALLRTLAGWWRSQGKEVDGFVAVAGERIPGKRGAARYDIEMLRDSKRSTYAVRDESRQPPYRFEEATALALGSWADGLGAGSRPSLVVVDEFGPVEAAGGGHLSLWLRILSAKPDLVVVAMRKGIESEIGTRLRTAFTLIIDADAPDAWESLRRACVEHSDWMRIGVFGGGAGGFEASVGTILHGTQIPMRGLFLSSMQSVIMTFAADGLGDRRRIIWVPFISASLKGLSPAGSSLRPMVAITAQGLLYGIAITLLGWNIVGVLFGGFLIGAWSAIQGVALQYLFVGNDLIRAYDSIILWVSKQLDVTTPGLLVLFLGWAVVCGIIAGGVTLLAWTRRHRIPIRLHDAVFAKAKGITLEGAPAAGSSALRRGLKDLTRPMFWLPVAIVVVITLATGSALQSALWIIVRAAAVGIVLFSLVRAFDVRRFIAWLQKRGHWGPALAFHRALGSVRSPEVNPPESSRRPSPPS